MVEKPRTPRRIALEASAWFKLLSNTSVRTEDLEAFSGWLRDPDNRAAYDRRSARSEFGRFLANRSKRASARASAGRPVSGDSGGNMATARQELGVFGETLVAKMCSCPRCKRASSLKALPPNFKCADLICDFCGFLGQVKATTVSDVSILPKTVLGAAWGPQRDRMQAGIYFPLFLVLRSPTAAAVYYLSADLQTPEMFKERAPLSANARRAGWQGFLYDLSSVRDRFVRLTPEDLAVPTSQRSTARRGNTDNSDAA